MLLGDLIRLSGLPTETLTGSVSDRGVEISSVAMDTRAVREGSLFFCVRGSEVDGHDLADAAVAAGAVALVCERVVGLPVPQVLVSKTREVVGPISAAFYGWPSREMCVVGVTGTNGKTTTCSVLGSVFKAAGERTAVIGTLSQVRTTPEAPELQERLRALRDQGTTAVAMEVSSHALVQGRADGLELAAGVFTNLSQDHLDFHGSMEQYFDAKATLFQPDRIGVAVVNRDDEWGRRLIERINVRTVTFGYDDIGDVESTVEGTRFSWRGNSIETGLVGSFNAMNVIAAATCAEALGLPVTTIREGIAQAPSVRGRFERVSAGQDFTVLVDYAHTPDGLKQALGAARELTSRNLIVVFGAGGDRDTAKRPGMGKVAAGIADLAVVTSDNPRGEDPVAIIEGIRAGVEEADRSKVRAEPDRQMAITAALASASEGDVVVIAGKGHEQGQEVAGRVRPFDDVEVARRALSRILGSRASERAER